MIRERSATEPCANCAEVHQLIEDAERVFEELGQVVALDQATLHLESCADCRWLLVPDILPDVQVFIGPNQEGASVTEDDEGASASVLRRTA